MSRKKERIDVNPQQSGLNAAFAGLNISAPLPPGPAEAPVPTAKETPPRTLGRVVLRKEKAHRGGKTVIVVDDFAPQIRAEQIEEACRTLKNRCGTGGTVKERSIEVQGEMVAQIREILEELGYRVDGVR